jgi:hypothetical protein
MSLTAACSSNATRCCPESIYPAQLAPRSQAVAAVAEEQWQKQGLVFQSEPSRLWRDATEVLYLQSQQTLIFLISTIESYMSKRGATIESGRRQLKEEQLIPPMKASESSLK